MIDISFVNEEFKGKSADEKYDIIKETLENKGTKARFLGRMMSMYCIDISGGLLYRCETYTEIADKFIKLSKDEFIYWLNTPDGQVIRPYKHHGLSLSYLREEHAKHGFKGPCIVLFENEHYSYVQDLPGFRLVDDYRITKPMTNYEVGFVEMFHFSPAKPIEYVEFQCPPTT